MARVLVDDEYLEKLRLNESNWNGKEGNCYLSENNKIVKIFKDYYMVPNLLTDEIKHEQIAYPIDILYDKDGAIKGYTMNYLKGKHFINGFSDGLALTKLKKAYLDTRMIILKLVDVYMDDNCLDNMLYDYQANIINLIDISRWHTKLDGHLESINEFNWQMMNALLKNIDWKHFKLNQDKKLYELFIIYKYLENIPSLFIEFLNELELKVSEEKQEKVKTIKDLKI